MKKKILLAVLFVMALGMHSCGDDDNPVKAEQIADYFVLHLTSNWTSESFTVDAETGAKIGDSEYIFTEINREATISSKPCFEFTAWDYDYLDTKDRSNPTYNYFYTEGNKLYTHSSLLRRYLGGNDLSDLLPIEFPDGWLLFIDNTKDEWEMLNIPIDNLAIEYEGQPGTLTGALTAIGSKAGNDVLNIQGTDYECRKYVISFKLEGNLDIGLPIQIPLVGTLDLTIWLGKDTGLLKQTLSPFEIKIANEVVQKIDGSESVVIEFDLNK